MSAPESKQEWEARDAEADDLENAAGGIFNPKAELQVTEPDGQTEIISGYRPFL